MAHQIQFFPKAPHTFQAEWPKALAPTTCSKVWKVFWDVISVIIFPIGLARLAAWGLRKIFFSNVFPGAKIMFSKEELHQLGEEVLHDYNGQRVQITAPDGIRLDGVFIPGDKKKTIIFSGGNNSQWELFGRYAHILETGCNILIINPRTIGESDHSTPDEESLALDMWSGYDYLIREKGLDPEKEIVGIGHSMGAALINLGAAVVQDEYPEKKIGAINLRTFSNLAYAAKAFLQQNWKSCLSPIAAFFAPFLIRAIGANIDSESAFLKLKGKKCVFWHAQDEIIPLAAQIQTALAQNDTYHSVEMESFPHECVHNRRLTEKEKQIFHSHL